MMALLKSAFLIFYIILVSNVTLYRGTVNNESVMEESTCYALREPHLYSVTEENVNFSEELREEISTVESPPQVTLKIAKCYGEPRNSESLKKLLSFTCAPDKEKQI
ncbi:PREDICTED: uncharacterized protein LOC105458378 isoform X1 [Wasmannia auropunctata]|uniref:uncharacterized protein LOC105458378 isoform X1 n=1 Tax=Wasmannia auropunctata TaxID=64793 RepID=UPI0005EDE838|nr:PREDICTED: uncharacterized protein LOC105458378 isoform X1 [Wasmannia auropunctata]